MTGESGLTELLARAYELRIAELEAANAELRAKVEKLRGPAWHSVPAHNKLIPVCEWQLIVKERDESTARIGDKNTELRAEVERTKEILRAQGVVISELRAEIDRVDLLHRDAIGRVQRRRDTLHKRLGAAKGLLQEARDAEVVELRASKAWEFEVDAFLAERGAEEAGDG